MSESSLRGIAVVTGGATGIGAATSRALARAGFRVVVHHRSSHEAAEALVTELSTAGRALAVPADLSTEEGVELLAKTVGEQPEPCQVLVNNAGFTVDAPLFSAKLADLDSVVALNLRGTWLLTKRISRQMSRKKFGRIINISSVVGSTGNPYQSVYGMTKGAIDNLTKTLAGELAPFGILVNSVAPGFIDTAMTRKLPEAAKQAFLDRIPMKRLGTSDEVADVVEFLATRGAYVTGTVIHVNGGMYGG
jgi:3-oxoacyl-[acyl-carrier protein] reductase